MSTGPGRVLVVDDSRSKRYILGSWLRRAGYDIDEATTGAEALSRLAGTPIDAVVLDVRLPDMSGFEVCERIKSDPRFGAVPVVHVSATAVHAVDRTEGLDRGADAYLVEPIDPGELLATLRSVLRYYRARAHAEGLAARLTKLADTTLAVNSATTFEGLLLAAARGAAGIFGGPAVAAAVTPGGETLTGSVSGPGDTAVCRRHAGDAAETPLLQAQVGASVAARPWQEWEPVAPLWRPAGTGAGDDVWVALARPRADRPAALVAVPVAGTMHGDDRVLIQLAQAVALAVEAMRSYGQERYIALTLQRSLLPRVLPEVDGYDLAVRYLPASAYAEVGGDFYELARYGDELIMAIGDVVGHSLHAATVMAELRHALRAYVAEGYPPDVVLERLNSLMIRFIPDEIATVCVLSLDPRSGRLRIANAGHLPPLLVSSGVASFLPVQGPLLGIPVPRPALVRADMPPGGTLTLFTDGLVERRGQIIDAGMAKLATAAAATDGGLEEYCDRLVAGMGPADQDDVALVVVRRH